MSSLGYSTMSIIPTAKGFGPKLSRLIDPQVSAAGKKSGMSFGKAMGIGALAVAGVAIAGLAAVVHTGIQETLDASAGTAQLAAGIKSTGNAANVTVIGMNELASSIEAYSGQTDDSIVKSQQLLLTFTNIRNTGVNKIFDDATKASADMAAKMGGDASGNAILLGKALNDPIKGVTALTRVGVSFTDGQKESIKSMVAAGNTMGAQKLILAELNKEFGGAAKAAGDSLPGQLQKAQRAFEGVAQSVVETLLPMVLPGLQSVASFLTGTVVPAVQSFLKEFRDGVGPGGSFKGMLESVGGTLRTVFGFMAATVIPVLGFMLSAVTAMPAPILMFVGALAILSTSAGQSLVTSINGAISWLKTMGTTMKFNIQFAQLLAAEQRGAGASAGIMATGTVLASSAMAGLSGALKAVWASLGPVGLALGIAAAAAAFFTSKSDSGSASTQSWTQALYDQNGALAANAIALTAKAVQDDEAFKNMTKFGITNKQVTAGLMGDSAALTDARRKLNAVIAAGTAAQDTDRLSANYLNSAQFNNAESAKAMLAALNDKNNATVIAAKNAKELGNTVTALGGAAQQVIPKLNGAGGAAKAMSTAFDEASSASLTEMQGWVTAVKSALAEAKQEWQDYGKQVFAALTGQSGIGAAWSATTDQLKAVQDAQKELGDAESALAKARQRDAEDRAEFDAAQAKKDPSDRTAFKANDMSSVNAAVADAQARLAAAQSAAKDFEANVSAGIDSDVVFGNMFQQASTALIAQFGKDSPIWQQMRDTILNAPPGDRMGLATSLMNGFSPEMVAKLKAHDLWAGEVSKGQANLNFGQGEQMSKDVVKGLKAQIKAESARILQVGKNIGGGVIEGFASKLGDFNAEIGKWVKEINIKWEISSPSKVAYRIGRFIGLGQIMGLKSTDAEMRAAFTPPVVGSLDSASSVQRAAAVAAAVDGKQSDSAELVAEMRLMREEYRRTLDMQVAMKRSGAIS